MTKKKKKKNKKQTKIKNLNKLEKSLKIKFKNPDLFHRAFTHRSFLNENKEWPYGHNERLEFLGDAVLELASTLYLYSKFNLPEGKLTFLRASLINTESLAKVAKKIGLDKFLYASLGSKKNVQKSTQTHILADTFEAFIGALYLDQGFKTVQKFLKDRLFKRASFILSHNLYKDPKSIFQELVQGRFKITPKYNLIKEQGPSHARKFTVQLIVGQNKISQGQGSSKQQAEKKAAENALKNWEKVSEIIEKNA